MRYAIFLLLSTLFVSCQPNLEIQGFWVGVDEEGNWSDQTIEVTADSIFIYHYFGMPLKSTYSTSGSKIKSGTTYQLFSNEKFHDGREVEIEISEDTLYWKLSSTPDKYIRSRFNSYVEHYANSKGLRIDLPVSDTFIESDYNSNTYVDLFIGYNENNEIKFGVNDLLFDSGNSLTQWMNQESDQFNTRFILRLFADKAIPSDYVISVREAMKQSNIHLLQNVTKPSTRQLINLYQNPYSNHFYGTTMLVRAEPKIEVIAE
jgi:biopolymer transport protein ExbD